MNELENIFEKKGPSVSLVVLCCLCLVCSTTKAALAVLTPTLDQLATGTNLRLALQRQSQKGSQ